MSACLLRAVGEPFNEKACDEKILRGYPFNNQTSVSTDFSAGSGFEMLSGSGDKKADCIAEP
jgi:hypothetical protein